MKIKKDDLVEAREKTKAHYGMAARLIGLDNIFKQSMESKLSGNKESDIAFKLDVINWTLLHKVFEDEKDRVIPLIIKELKKMEKELKKMLGE